METLADTAVAKHSEHADDMLRETVTETINYAEAETWADSTQREATRPQTEAQAAPPGPPPPPSAQPGGQRRGLKRGRAYEDLGEA